MAFKSAKAKQIRQSDLYNSVVDLAKYTEDEFAQVASALQGDDPFTILFVAPKKPRTGMFVYADGTHWNPGAGEGFYEYTSGGVWVPLFVNTGNAVTSIAGATGAFTLNTTSGIKLSGHDIQLSQGSASQFGAFKVDNSTIVATLGVLSTATPLPTPIHASLGADVALNNTANYFDGPSIAQGTVGTWFVSGIVTCANPGTADQFFAKLWDGTTVIASGAGASLNSSNAVSIPLSGYIVGPVANIRISVRAPVATTGSIKFNFTGNSKDSTISAFRIA